MTLQYCKHSKLIIDLYQDRTLEPTSIAVDPSGNFVYVTISQGSSSEIQGIQKFDTNGEYILQWGSGCDLRSVNPPGGVRYFPEYKDLDDSGPLAVGDGEFDYSWNLAVDPTDNSVYVVDYGNDRIQKFDSNDKYIAKVVWNPGSPISALDITFDSSGNAYILRYQFSSYVSPNGFSNTNRFCNNLAICKSSFDVEVRLFSPPCLRMLL